MPAYPERANRREFLCTLARGAAAGLAVPQVLGSVGRAAGAAEKWKLRLATSSIHYMGLPIEQACERIAALGFEAVDIWSAHAGCPHLDDVQKRLGPGGLKELLARTKLKLSAFSVYAGGYRRYAELLGQVGGAVAVQGCAGPCPPKETAARMRAFLEGLRPDVELAEKHNSYLAIENHGSSLLDSLDSFKAFVELNKSPRVGLALAPYHLQAIGASVEEAIAISGKQLFFFYAWQQADGMKQLPGHGPTDFGPWMAALAKIEYPRYVNPFMHGEVPPEAMSAGLAKSREYLRKCAEGRVRS
ncbi:MAG: sugar phosphate isomerase/epimerase family protein [Pirellulales bacterium]